MEARLNQHLGLIGVKLDRMEKEIHMVSTQVGAVVSAEAAEAGLIQQVLTIVQNQATQIAALQAQIAALPLSPDDAAAIQTVLTDIATQSAALSAVLTPAPTPTI